MSNFVRTIRILFVIAICILVGALIWNADIVVRAIQAIQARSFTIERLRFDIASFDMGRAAKIIPTDNKASKADGMTQLFVPAGEFIMGAQGEPDVDSPQHPVYLDAYWIDQVEVTNSLYEKCVRAAACSPPAPRLNPYYGRWVYRDYPVVYVSWYQASAYCAWTGRRLPTEAEWEKAARGTDQRKYPWGDTPPNPRLANFTNSLIGESLPAYRYPLGASPYGALNMAGNVREWVSDWFGLRYYAVSPYMNPKGPETGTERSMRSGGYDADANEILVTSRYKHEPQSAGLSRGFRCAEGGD